MYKAFFLYRIVFLLLLTNMVSAQDEIPENALESCLSTDKSTYFNCLDSLQQHYTSVAATMQVIYTKGRFLLRVGDPDSAARLAMLGGKLAKGNRNREGELAFASMLAVANKQKGDFKKAISDYMHIIRISEEMGQAVNAAIIKNNVAVIYIQLKDFQSADTILKSAYKTFKKHNDSDHIAITKGMIAFVQLKLGDTLTAIKTSRETLAFSKKINSKDAIAKVSGILAGIFEHQRLYDSSIYYYKQTVETAREISGEYYITMSKIGLMSVYFKTQQYTKADQLANELKSTIGNSLASEKTKFYFTYSDILAHTGRYREAYEYLHMASDLNNEIAKTENKRIVNEIYTKYQTEKKDKEIARNKLIMQQQSNLLYKRNLYLILLVSALPLLILAIIMIRMRNKYKIEQLNEQKQLQVLNAHIEGEEKERKRVARELHDSIANELAVIKMGLESIVVTDQYAKQKQESLSKMISNIHKEARRISHNLNPVQSIKNRFADAVKEYLENIPIGNGHIEVNVLDKSDLNITPEKLLLIFRTIQELVGNALRHSDANSILVDMIISNEQVNISVSDDGRGIDKEILSNPETLSSIKENVVLLDGLLDVDSNINEGTSVMISIPNKK